MRSTNVLTFDMEPVAITSFLLITALLATPFLIFNLLLRPVLTQTSEQYPGLEGRRNGI